MHNSGTVRKYMMKNRLMKVVAGEERRRVTYHDIVQFADSLASALVFVHYLAVLLVEIRHSSPQ